MASPNKLINANQRHFERVIARSRKGDNTCSFIYWSHEIDAHLPNTRPCTPIRLRKLPPISAAEYPSEQKWNPINIGAPPTSQTQLNDIGNNHLLKLWFAHRKHIMSFYSRGFVSLVISLKRLDLFGPISFVRSSTASEHNPISMGVSLTWCTYAPPSSNDLASSTTTNSGSLSFHHLSFFHSSFIFPPSINHSSCIYPQSFIQSQSLFILISATKTLFW